MAILPQPSRLATHFWPSCYIIYIYIYTHTHTHKKKTQHTQGSVGWHTHINMYLNQLLCAHSSYLYYIVWGIHWYQRITSFQPLPFMEKIWPPFFSKILKTRPSLCKGGWGFQLCTEPPKALVVIVLISKILEWNSKSNYCFFGSLMSNILNLILIFLNIEGSCYIFEEII